MLTEKKLYKLLKDIKNKKEFDAISDFDYRNGNIPQKILDNDYNEFRLLFIELLDCGYVYPESIKFAFFNSDFPLKYFPVLISYPIITVEGNNFMENYRRQSLKFIPITLDWTLRIIGAYAIIKEPVKIILKILKPYLFK